MKISEREKAREKLMEMLKQPKPCELGEVISVNTENFTCVVTLVNGTKIPDVRLKAGVDGFNDGIVQIPEVGSSVILCRIGDDPGTRFILAYSKVVETIFNGGANGGLIKWSELKTEMEKTSGLVTAMKNLLTGWTVTAGDGGAALKAAALLQLNPLTVGDYNNKENVKVKH